MRAVVIALPALSLVLLGACGDGKSTDTSEADTDTDADSDGDSDADSDSDTDSDAVGTLAGTLVWEDGSGASGVQARLCFNSCRAVTTEPDGSYSFDDADAVMQDFQAVKLGDLDYSTPNGPVMVNENEVRTLDDITIPEWGAKQTLTSAADVAGDHGLTISADPSGMSMGGYSQTSDTFVATAWVDPSASGLPFDGITGEVIGMWYLGNFDFVVDPAWSFQVDSDLGLNVGDSVQVLLADTTEHEWRDAGTATVDSDGVLKSDTGGGISLLTTLLLVK